MRNNLYSLFQRSAINRYLTIGLAVYVLEMAIIMTAQLAGLTAVFAIALSFIVGTVVSFILQKIVTFKDKRTQHKIVGVQAIAVCALVGFNFLFTVASAQLLATFLPAIFIRTITLVMTTAWNYYLYRTRIFNESYKSKRMKGLILQLYTFLHRYSFVLTAIAGSALVSAWTMLRFFNRPMNFDLVGQQVLTHQWMTSDTVGGAVIGPTNYLVKMLFVYLPFDLLPGAAQLKLIIMTLLVNILTFILVIVVLRLISREFKLKFESGIHIAVLWMATISGSIYWIQFTNSRNIEMVGGLFLVYLGLRAFNRSSTWNYIGIGLLSGVLFFADPLQVYMTVAPFIALVTAFLLRKRTKQLYLVAIKLGIALVCGWVASKLLTIGVERWFGVEFIATSTQFNWHSTWESILSTPKQLAALYIGGLEFSRVIWAINIIFVALMFCAGTWYAWRRHIRRDLFGAVVIFWGINIAVYVASGQALVEGTSRYLIMTVVPLVLLISAILSTKIRYQKIINAVTVGVVAVNACALVLNLSSEWDVELHQNSHANTTIQYMEDSTYSYGYASMDTTFPATFLSGSSVRLLPLECSSDSRVRASRLFFDWELYKQTASSAAKLVPIVLDGDSINNHPSTCSRADIESQLGEWQYIQTLGDGSDILIYDAQKVRKILQIE